MSKATGWDCYLGASGRNLVCQDPGACCCEPAPASPSPSDSRRSSLTDVLTVPCGMSLEWRPLRSSPHLGEAVHLPQALCSPGGRAGCGCGAAPAWRGAAESVWRAPLTLLTQPVLAPWRAGCLSLPHVLGLPRWWFVTWLVVSCSPCEGMKSGMTYVIILVIQKSRFLKVSSK